MNTIHRQSWVYLALVLLATTLSLTSLEATAEYSLPPSEECPQPRFTGKAPDRIYDLNNPLQATKQNIKNGKRLYRNKPHAEKIACSTCHGKNGNGKGPMSEMFYPPPRNFACVATVNGIPDGQLFWIIKNGSPGTGMPNFKVLSDRQIWLLVLYLRKLAK